MSVKKAKRATAVHDVESVLAWLKGKSTKKDRENLARFGIHARNALGVSMANMRVLAKQVGRDHALAAELWKTECYEARMFACLIDDPARVTPAQMERWRRDFDNWAICDTACFALFDRTPHAYAKIAPWSRVNDEYGKRAAFALLACLALHDRKAADAPFLDGLALAERNAGDARNFVKKGVSWAVRAIGGRNRTLHAAALDLARRLAASEDATERWIGKDILKDLTRPTAAKRVARGDKG